MRGGDYERIGRAIEFLDAHRLEQPTLDEVAEQVGLSPYHLQRLFKRWAGVSPKRFLQHLTLEHARALLVISAGSSSANSRGRHASIMCHCT